MKVRQLLQKTRLKLVTCEPSDRLERIATMLSDACIGAVPVTDGRAIVGILSERDVCRGVGQYGEDLASMKVRSLMTRDVAVCDLEDSVKSAIATMRGRHIRHLPVVDKGRLVGMISLRDVLEASLEQTRLEADVLRDHALSKPRTGSTAT
jgi:CBS domain-containing protein